MIQRYVISIEIEAGCEWISDELEYTSIVPKPDDNGEWVKWEDVKHLVLINEALNICTKLPENYDFFQKPIDVTEFLKEIQNDTTR